MPFYIRTREGRFSDGVEIDSESLFAYMENKDSEVTTECASVEEYENFFAERLSEAESVIHITPLMESSESFNRASEAAKVFGNVHVVNSGHASCGLGLMVLIAANLVREGYSVEAICDRMGELQNIVVTSVLLGSVEQMYRNGKYGRIMKNFCAMFQLRPVLHMVKSRPRCRRILTGNFDKALQHYIHREFHNSERVDKRILFIAYAGCSAEEIDRIRDLVEKEVEFQNIVVQKASATVASNVGLGTIGLMYMKAGGDGR
jgi:DegV family protein with EDD domain